MGRAIQAIMAQAPPMMEKYKADLAARGLGFTAGRPRRRRRLRCRAPQPAGERRPGRRCRGDAARPGDGDGRRLPGDRLRRVGPAPRGDMGMSLEAYAVAAKAVGWANGDDALIERVCAALGVSRADYDQAGAHWTEVLKTDMPVATLYGQLFARGRRDPRRWSRRAKPARAVACGSWGSRRSRARPPAASQPPTTRAASRRGL